MAEPYFADINCSAVFVKLKKPFGGEARNGI